MISAVRKSAERMRRLRQRRKDGVVAIIQLEVLKSDIPALVRHGFLDLSKAGNRAALEESVTDVFEAWLDDA